MGEREIRPKKDPSKKYLEHGIFFIALMRMTNATSMKLTLNNVTMNGENVGDYEVSIRQIDPAKGAQ